MKKVFFLFLITLFFIPPASAESLDMQVFPAKLTAYAYRPQYYTLTITNNNHAPVGTTIKIQGIHLEWASPADVYVLLQPFEARVYNLNFYPTGLDRGVFNYRIVAEPDDISMSGSADLELTVYDPVILKELKTEPVPEGLKVTATLESVVRQDFDVVFDVEDDEGIVTSLAVSMEDIEGETVLSRTIVIPKSVPSGEYNVKVGISGPNIAGFSAEQSSEVMPIHNVIETVKKESSPLYDFYTVRIENRGNVVEDYVTYTTVPSDLITGFLTRPEDCITEGGSRQCRYVVSSLGPGETKQINYRVEYWPLLIPYIVIAIVIAAVAGGAFRQATKPTVAKRYSRKSGNTHSIIIQIRNPFYYNLENVVLRDWVSPLAYVMPDEFDSVKPVMKKSDAGTELIWNLGNVKPNEERIITYKVKPIVEGPGLKMPPAKVKYTDSKGNTGWISSGTIIIE